MLDPPSGDAEHAALKWIDAAARPLTLTLTLTLTPNPNPNANPNP